MKRLDGKLKPMTAREASVISRVMAESYKGKPIDLAHHAMAADQWNQTPSGHAEFSHRNLGTKNWTRFKRG